jgi:hypothetical protein
MNTLQGGGGSQLQIKTRLNMLGSMSGFLLTAVLVAEYVSVVEKAALDVSVVTQFVKENY